jgi:hypothetical protein
MGIAMRVQRFLATRSVDGAWPSLEWTDPPADGADIMPTTDPIQGDGTLGRRRPTTDDGPHPDVAGVVEGDVGSASLVEPSETQEKPTEVDPWGQPATGDEERQ